MLPPFSRDSNLALSITASETEPEKLLSSTDAAPADDSITLAARGPLYRERLNGTTDHQVHDIQLAREWAEKDWKVGDVLEGFRVAKRRQAHLPASLGIQPGPQETTSQHNRDLVPGASLVAPGTVEAREVGTEAPRGLVLGASRVAPGTMKANTESGQVGMEAPESTGERGFERLVSVAQMPRKEQGFEDGVPTKAFPALSFAQATECRQTEEASEAKMGVSEPLEASVVRAACAVSPETEDFLPLIQAEKKEEGPKENASPERKLGSSENGAAIGVPDAQACGVELKDGNGVLISEGTAEEIERAREDIVRRKSEESGLEYKLAAAETGGCEGGAGVPVSSNGPAELELGSGKLPGESFSRTEVGPVRLEKGYLGARVVELEKKRSIPVSLNGTPPRAEPEEVAVAAEGCAAGSVPVGVVATDVPVQLAEFRPSLKPVKTHLDGSAFSTRANAMKVRTAWIGTFDIEKHSSN